MFRAILWKEWREQRWKLAFGCVLLMGTCAIGLKTRAMHADNLLVLVAMLGVLVLPLLTTIELVASDREERALGFLMALPYPAWRVFWVKAGVTLLNTLLPLLGAIALWFAVERRQSDFAELRMLPIWSSWIAASLVLWTAALGMRQPTEARVALVGIVVIVFWLFSIAVLDALRVMPLLGLFNPFAVSIDVHHLSRYWAGRMHVPWIAQSVVLILISLWGARRYARLGGEAR